MACALPDVWCPTAGVPSECCELHKDNLSVFCLDDLQPLCQQCATEGHSQHRVYPLSEAVTDCKGELKSSVNNLKQKMTGFEKVTQDYQQVSKHNQAVSEVTEAHIKKEFEQLHQLLLKEEADRLLKLNQEKEKKMSDLQEQLKLMDEMVRSLEARIRLTEEELDAGGDGVQFLKHYQEEPSKSPCTDLKNPDKSFLINVAKHLGNLRVSVWNKIKQVAPYTPVTLDPRTAGQDLTVPYSLNTLHSSPGAVQQVSLCVPDHPERFHPHSAVLGREGFNSGEHCWEIELDHSDNWTVGVASQSIPRQEQFEVCPETGLWCICLWDGQYLALTTPAQTLSLDTSLKRITVKLQWDEGLLEFYDADTGASVFTFKHQFNQMVYPYFESLSNNGSMSLVAKEATLRIILDGEDVEDSVANQEIEWSNQDENQNKRSKCEDEKLSKEKKNKSKKRIVKNGFIKSKPAVKQAPCNIMFSEEYHVSLFRLLKIVNNENCNQKKHG